MVPTSGLTTAWRPLLKPVTSQVIPSRRGWGAASKTSFGFASDVEASVRRPSETRKYRVPLKASLNAVSTAITGGAHAIIVPASGPRVTWSRLMVYEPANWLQPPNPWSRPASKRTTTPPG